MLEVKEKTIPSDAKMLEKAKDSDGEVISLRSLRKNQIVRCVFPLPNDISYEQLPNMMVAIDGIVQHCMEEDHALPYIFRDECWYQRQDDFTEKIHVLQRDDKEVGIVLLCPDKGDCKGEWWAYAQCPHDAHIWRRVLAIHPHHATNTLYIAWGSPLLEFVHFRGVDLGKRNINNARKITYNE